jgi:hypothetical protein
MGEELRAVQRAFAAGALQPDLVDEGRRLQRHRRLAGQMAAGQALELGVEQGVEAVARPGVAAGQGPIAAA